MNNKEYVENLVKRKYKRKPRRGTAEEKIEPYQVEVRYDDVMKAYKVLERMLKKDRVLETYTERQRYKKPSERRHEENKRRKKAIAKENRLRRLEEDE